MTPARDYEPSGLPSLYLLASIVPTGSGATLNISGCAPNVGNQSPYVIEYTADTTGVFGSNGCSAGSSGCIPASRTAWRYPGSSLVQPAAEQLIDSQYDTPNICGSTTTACLIDAGNARITAAQIRLSNISGTNTPILATGFTTGILSSQPLSQDLWFIENMNGLTWLDAIESDDPNGWLSYPTINNPTRISILPRPISRLARILRLSGPPTPGSFPQLLRRKRPRIEQRNVHWACG